MRFLQRDKRDPKDIDILWFSLGKFNFRWFIDNGEWFIYTELECKNRIKGYRFSSAGNMKLNYLK